MTTLTELEAAAKALIDPGAYEYYAEGAGAGITLAENVAAWKELRLRPHVLRDVSAVSTEVSLFGRTMRLPVVVAPMAYQRLAHDRGEAEMATGVAAADTVMCVSTMATVSLEDVANAAPGAGRWFQLYVHTDRELTASLVSRAAEAGYEAIVFTADLPVLGQRHSGQAHFDIPPEMELANLAVVGGAGSDLESYAASSFDPSLTYDTIGWLHELTDLPVLVKGVLRGDDADAAVRAGADGVVVSNHGGRQLDTAIATAHALADVVAAVDKRVPVLVDGGIRSATDVLKALALGASAAMVGRPMLWALAVGGASGVTELLDDFRRELERAMALVGASEIAELKADLVI